jgi:small GTP-binding protein
LHITGASGGIRMAKEEKCKYKICLVGEGAVGKTSLIRRFVFDEFKDTYISTIGTKITKKEMTLKQPSGQGEMDVTLIIWDIMGQKGFRQLLQEAYFYGAQAVIAVCNITDKNSLSELPGWVDSAFGVTGNLPVAFLANKCDLMDNAEFELKELSELASKYDKSFAYPSSAKTGENVMEAFEKLIMEISKEE